MTANETKTMTLSEFLSNYAICRVWYITTAKPYGHEHFLNTDTDCDEDYCDSEGLMNVLGFCGATKHAEELEGKVTRDSDGEYRWDVISFEDVDARDTNSNTLLNVAVWGLGDDK